MHAIRTWRWLRWLRWLRWRRGPDYEEELPRLSRDIARARMRLLTATNRHRRWPFLFLVQAIAIYVTYVATVLRMAWHRHPRHMVALPLALLLVLAVYRAISNVTAWRKGQVDAQLKQLTAKRKVLVEDYKRKTQFDKIQRLISLDEPDDAASHVATQQTNHRANPRKDVRPLGPGTEHSGTRAARSEPGTDEKSPTASQEPTSLHSPHAAWDARRAAGTLASQDAPSPSPDPVPVYNRSWVDRVLDLLVGENELGPENRFALICAQCHAHNGLAPAGKPAEDVVYRCRICNFLNNAPHDASDPPSALIESTNQAEPSTEATNQAELSTQSTDATPTEPIEPRIEPTTTEPASAELASAELASE